jgi:GT2 family glycosyltransferase
MSTLTIAIVNYNSTDFLRRCLDSIFEQTELDPFRAVVVDNASTDRDFSEIEERYPDIAFILNEENRGFAVACNQAVQRYPADNYLLLNPDCLIETHAIDKCLDFLDSHSEIGIVGCRVRNPDGSLQLACRRQIPGPSTAFYRFSGLSRVFPNNPRFAAYNVGYLDDDQNHEVGAVSGSFLMFRHQVYQDTGGLDERFFLYGEDLDFCYRTTLAGWKVYYYAGAEVTHFKNVSSRSDSKRSTFHFYRSMETFYRKHFSAEANRLERLLVPVGIRLLYAAKRIRQIVFRKSDIGSAW